MLLGGRACEPLLRASAPLCSISCEVLRRCVTLPCWANTLLRRCGVGRHLAACSSRPRPPVRCGVNEERYSTKSPRLLSAGLPPVQKFSDLHLVAAALTKPCQPTQAHDARRGCAHRRQSRNAGRGQGLRVRRLPAPPPPARHAAVRPQLLHAPKRGQQRPSSAPVPPQDASGGPRQFGTPRKRSAH